MTEQKGFQLVDYYTNKIISPRVYETEEEAHQAIKAYLSYKQRSGDIHNNLIIVQETN